MANFIAAHNHRLRRILYGSQGLRSGWSIAIFAVLVAPGDLIAIIARHHLPSLLEGDIAIGDSLVLETLLLAVILGAMAIMGRIERRNFWSSYGFSESRPIKKLLFGLGGGLVCLSLVVGAMNAGGYLVFDARALHGLPALGYGLIWLLDFMIVGLREEAMFRGYLQATLTRGIGFWPAAVLLSLWFGASHLQNAGESTTGIMGVIAHALFYCLLLRLSGSLWLGIGFHAAWDWAQSYLYGTPQSGHLMQGHLLTAHARGDSLMSGGSVGPEGSLFGLPAQILGLFAFLWAVKRAGLYVKGRDRRVLLHTPQ